MYQKSGNDYYFYGYSEENSAERTEPHGSRNPLRQVCICAAMAVVVLLGCVWTVLNVYSFSLDGNMEGYERDLMEEYELGVENFMIETLDGIYSVKKTYMIQDSVTVMPEPDPNAFGKARSVSELDEVIARAEEYGLVSAEDVIFPGEGISVLDNCDIRYYLDETILTISWRTEIEQNVYNFTEVVINHPSQFRKYITNNEYASSVRKTVSTMSQELNAVVGMSCDFYAYRSFGIMVYNGKVYRGNERYLDTCFVNTDGELIMSHQNELLGDAVQEFVENNNINFSISFGPIIVEDYKVTPHAADKYRVGQPLDTYSRAAIGQLGSLHYLLCSVDGGTVSAGEYRSGIKVARLAKQMQAMGCEKAYTLDGGQTATMTVDGDIFNCVGYGSERPVSDIILFATAMPEGSRAGGDAQ